MLLGTKKKHYVWWWPTAAPKLLCSFSLNAQHKSHPLTPKKKGICMFFTFILKHGITVQRNKERLSFDLRSAEFNPHVAESYWLHIFFIRTGSYSIINKEINLIFHLSWLIVLFSHFHILAYVYLNMFYSLHTTANKNLAFNHLTFASWNFQSEDCTIK